MEVNLNTPISPLSREEIKELRKIRNKEKKHRKQQEKKALKPQSTPTVTQNLTLTQNKHVTIVTKDVYDTVNSAPKNSGYKNVKLKKTNELFGNLVELQAQQSCHNSSIQAMAKYEKPGIVTKGGNKMDKEQPVLLKGKQSEHIKPKKLSSLKKQIVNLEKLQIDSKIETNPINYIDNIITDTLEMLSINFIEALVELQEKYYKNNPNKAAVKRRYIVGLHQLKKYIIIKKIQLFFIACDLQLTIGDPLFSTIKEIINLADKNGIFYVFALKRRQIGRISLKNLPVTCLGVLNYDGLNEDYKTLLEEINNCKRLFQESQGEKEQVVYNNLLINIKEQLVT